MKKIKLLSILFLLFTLVSCEKDSETYLLNDWVGNWKIPDQQKSLQTKAAAGTIALDYSRPDNGLIISGQLFNLGTFNILGTVLGNNVTFNSNSNSSGMSIYGSGEIINGSTIEFTWTTNGDGNETSYEGTAIKN